MIVVDGIKKKKMEGAQSQCVVFLSHAGPNLHLAVLSATTFGLWQQLDHLPLLA